MSTHKHHKVFVGFTAIIVLVIGLFLGAYLATNLGTIDLEAIKVGLMLTTIILLLIVGGLVLEIKDFLKPMQPKKGRK